MLMSLGTRVMADAAFLSLRYPRLLAISRGGVTALAGLAAAYRPLPAAAAACCTGPYGTGPCEGYSDCSGSTCTNDCSFVSGFCPTGSACWSSYSCSGTCCDCQCYGSTGWYWCYCFG